VSSIVETLGSCGRARTGNDRPKMTPAMVNNPRRALEVIAKDNNLFLATDGKENYGNPGQKFEHRTLFQNPQRKDTGGKSPLRTLRGKDKNRARMSLLRLQL